MKFCYFLSTYFGNKVDERVTLLFPEPLLHTTKQEKIISVDRPWKAAAGGF